MLSSFLFPVDNRTKQKGENRAREEETSNTTHNKQTSDEQTKTKRAQNKPSVGWKVRFGQRVLLAGSWKRGKPREAWRCCKGGDDDQSVLEATAKRTHSWGCLLLSMAMTMAAVLKERESERARDTRWDEDEDRRDCYLQADISEDGENGRRGRDVLTSSASSV